MITGVQKIVVPVDDPAAAKKFWTETVGFSLVTDEPYGAGERWIEVATTDDAVALILSRRPPQQPRPSVPDQLPHSPVFFTCDDIQRTYAELSARSVKFPAPPMKMPFGWWAMFEDQEGSRYALGQW